MSDKDLKVLFDELNSLSKEQYDEVLKLIKSMKASNITRISTDYHCPNYGLSSVNCQCDYCKKAEKETNDFVQQKLNAFPGLVKEYLKHHTAQELADYCEAAPATINRWANNTASPRFQTLCWVSDYIIELAEKENWG